MFEVPKLAITVAQIIGVVAKHYDLRTADLVEQRAARRFARPRQIAMYLARQMTERSFPEIGRAFKRDPSTVFHAIGAIHDLRAKSPSLDAEVLLLTEMCGDVARANSAKKPTPQEDELMNSPSRRHLPDRRQNDTREITWQDQKFTLTIGYDAAGEPLEVFADGHREGSLMRHTLADACVIISIALQHGIGLGELAKSLGTVPAWHLGREVIAPASPIGAIMAVVAPRPDLAFGGKA